MEDHKKIADDLLEVFGSREAAIKHLAFLINFADNIHKPEYTTYIHKYASEDSPAITMNMYEAIDYWSKVMSQL